MLFTIIKYSLFISLLSSLGSCHVFRLGECPEIEPMPAFDMDRFLGQWYIIQKFKSASDCVRENFTKIDDHFLIRRSSRPFGSPVITNIQGQVFIRNNDSSGDLEIDFPLTSTGVINLRQYVVLATDYDNYALVWNCHKMIVGHRQSAQIMARTPQMERKIISELRELLANYEINEHYLTIVRQRDCEYRPGGDKPFIDIDGNVDCDKDQKPGQRVDKSGIHVKIGPFQFSAILPFK